MKTYSHYDEGGRFTGRRVSIPTGKPAPVAAVGGWMPGAHDPARFRVDMIHVYGEDGEKRVEPGVVPADMTPPPGDGVDNPRGELARIDAALIRYLDAELEGTLDDEGKARRDALRARKRELRALLSVIPE